MKVSSGQPKKEHAYPKQHTEAEEPRCYLITFKRMYRNQSGNTALNPLLKDIAHNSSENFVWINKSKAEEMGIEEGATVKLESRLGEVDAKAHITEGIRPDTVAVSYHYGQWSKGLPEQARTGININQIIELHPDVISGMNSSNDTKVKVRTAWG